MRLPITVTPREGKPLTIYTNPWAVLVWERKYKTKIAAAIEAGFGLEDLGYLAYTAAKQNGIEVPASFDEWMQTLDDLSTGEDEGNPTSAAPSDD